MWSVRRGIASATAEGLRKFSPNLGQYSHPLRSWCPPVSHSSNLAKNLEATSNYLRIIEEPELPNLVKFYEQVCRGCHRIPVGSTKLRRSALDDPPRKCWQKNDSEKYRGNNLYLRINNSAKKSNGTISGSKKPQRFFMNLTKHNSLKISKNFQKNNFRAVAGSNILKINNPLLKLPKGRNVHNHFMNSIHSHKFLMNRNVQNSSLNPTKPNNYETYIPQKKPSQSMNSHNSTEHSAMNSRLRTKLRSQKYAVSGDENATTSHLQDNSKKEIGLDRNSMTQWIIDRNFVSPGPTDLYDFGPLDLQSYAKNFESTHSIQPYIKISSQRVGKPSTKRARIREKKVNLPRAPRRQLKNKYCKTGSCKRPSCFAKPYKYHLFRFEVCPRKRRTRRKTVSCQTEVNQNRCELCDFSRPRNEPDEPFMIEMRRRQDREQLKQYYLKMAEREKQYCADTEKQDLNPTEPRSKSFSKSRTTCNGNVGKMRHELKKCLVTLNLCGRLVEYWLQLSRCK
ncbi:uncharacterized protein LOC6546721 [Drosophila erecta]|uniref:Uncharacterized protein n=1 Tax=Drosophila erecta TaxID=7220 RepID=B3NLL8_DROER|nr:uncharacterized protein LOC6546721 [Drosophila erecta]EDV54993.2 uncharacterized protein Dere_GG21009 [Drosophila erecta]